LSGAKIIRKGQAAWTETPLELKRAIGKKLGHGGARRRYSVRSSSTSKVVMGRTVEAALQAATAVSIVAIHKSSVV